jgi:hypothetical protein
VPSFAAYFWLGPRTCLRRLRESSERERPNRTTYSFRIAALYRQCFDLRGSLELPANRALGFYAIVAAAAALSNLRELEGLILNKINNAPDSMNSHAAGLLSLASEISAPPGPRYFVCDTAEQAKAARSFFIAHQLDNVEAVVLRDLPVDCEVIVGGWISFSFVRKLWAHSPRSILAVVDNHERERWEQSTRACERFATESLLSAVEGSFAIKDTLSAKGEVATGVAQDDDVDPEIDTDAARDERTPCVFLWVDGVPSAKVLPRSAVAFVDEGDIIKERRVARLRPDDGVILGSGSHKWSPADEFTEALVEAVNASHPALIEAAREWRVALQKMANAKEFSLERLRIDLKTVGIVRQTATLEGWLDTERASPIGPREQQRELTQLWPLIEGFARYQLDEIIAACARLRTLRIASGRALLQIWKGKATELGVDEAWLQELVMRLRQDVQVYEVADITCGEVPTALLGLWLPPTLVDRYEVDFASRADLESNLDEDGDKKDDDGSLIE